MERVGFITHGSKIILSIDLSDCQVEEALQVIAQAKSLVAAQPGGSLLTLTNVLNTHFNEKVTTAIRDLAEHNRPYVKAAAVIGITGLRRIVFDSVIYFTKRKLTSFNSAEEAKNWLVRQ